MKPKLLCVLLLVMHRLISACQGITLQIRPKSYQTAEYFASDKVLVITHNPLMYVEVHPGHSQKTCLRRCSYFSVSAGKQWHCGLHTWNDILIFWAYEIVIKIHVYKSCGDLVRFSASTALKSGKKFHNIDEDPNFCTELCLKI